MIGCSDDSKNALQAAWTMHQHIDCKDPYDKWLDAVIIDLKSNVGDGKESSSSDQLIDIKVSYTDFSEKYDEWIAAKDIPDRVLK